MALVVVAERARRFDDFPEHHLRKSLAASATIDSSIGYACGKLREQSPDGIRGDKRTRLHLSAAGQPDMSNDVYIVRVIDRLTNASQLDDSEFLRVWSSCSNGEVAACVSHVECLVNAESMERMAGIDADYRSLHSIISAIGITNLFEAHIKRNALDAEDTVRVLNCCSGKNIALAADLVRRLLDNLPHLIPLASQQLIQLAHQTSELPADRKPNELSLRGMAYMPPS